MKRNQSGFTVLEIILVVIIVGIICGVIGYVISNVTGKKNDSSSQSQASSGTVSKENDTNNEAEAAKKQLPELVTYPDNGVIVTSEADVVKLTDASDSFKSFVKQDLAANKSDGSCDQPYGIRVNVIYKDTFARGGAGDCGGAAIIWKKENNTWAKVWGGQQGIECSAVTKFSIPHQIADECLNDTTFEPQKNTL